MKEVIQTAICFLPMIWAAQAFLCLRDYRRDRRRPPLTKTEKDQMEERRAELEKLRADQEKAEAESPREQFKGLRWYLTHPKESFTSLMAALLFMLVVILFLPVAFLIWILPDPRRE